MNIISIHALREEGDAGGGVVDTSRRKFLSTPSARRATLSGCCRTVAAKQFLSTPSARRATSAPEAEPCTPQQFLSTPSARRATMRSHHSGWILINFYPRPPRGGRRASAPSPADGSNFYPRPPRGGRQQKQRQNLYFLINYTTFCTNLEEP